MSRMRPVRLTTLGLTTWWRGDGQQLLREVRGPLGGLLDFQKAGADGALSSLQLRLPQMGIASDYRQQVVEIMGHTAREPADSLHFLGLGNLVLQLPALGNVGRDAHRAQGIPFIILHERGAQPDGENSLPVLLTRGTSPVQQPSFLVASNISRAVVSRNDSG